MEHAFGGVGEGGCGLSGLGGVGFAWGLFCGICGFGLCAYENTTKSTITNSGWAMAQVPFDM